MIDELGQPGPARRIVHQPALEMGFARLGVGQRHALVTARGPAAHGGVGDVHVELQRIGGAAIAEGLNRKRIALRQHHGLVRQVEAFAVPLVDVIGPVLADGAAFGGRPDRVIADLGVAVGVLVDPGAEMLGQHLRAETDAEKRLLLLQRHADPIDLALDDLVVVVGALRSAENDRAAVLGERLGQVVAEPRTAHVERDVAVSKLDRDPSGGGQLPVQDDQDRRAHGQMISSCARGNHAPKRGNRRANLFLSG